jgi:hypothetical protein
MKNILLAIGILFIAAPFIILCLYAFTPWEPYRGGAAFAAGIMSATIGYSAMMIYSFEYEDLK